MDFDKRLAIALEQIAKKNGITEKDVDPGELKRGIEVEKEHTESAEEAKQIALDHLAEDPKYYTKLKKIHKD